MDREMEILLLKEMVNTEGWKIVDAWLEAKVQTCLVKLANTSAAEPSNISKLIQLQNIIKFVGELRKYITKQEET